MGACNVTLCAAECDEPTLRTNVGRGEPAAMLRQKLGEQIECEIMRTNAKNRAFDFGFASIQMDFDLLPCFHTLCTTRNESQSISLDKGSDHARATRQRCGEQPVPHLTDRNPNIIVISGWGNYFTSENSSFRLQFVQSSAQPFCHDGFYKDINSQGRRDRVTWNSNNGNYAIARGLRGRRRTSLIGWGILLLLPFSRDDT